jgi:hypothetical protein
MTSIRDLELRCERFRLWGGKNEGTGMDTGRRRSGDVVATPTVNEEFWAIVDATWSRNELAELVALCKAMEDAYTRTAARHS